MKMKIFMLLKSYFCVTGSLVFSTEPIPTQTCMNSYEASTEFR